MINRVNTADGVFWTVEMTGILVLPTDGCWRLLTGLEAAAWDLLNRGDGRKSVIRKLTAVGRLESQVVETAVDAWLESWRASGWIYDGGADG